MLRSRTFVFTALLSLLATVAAADTIHRTFNVAPGGTLTLDTDAGDVRVDPGASGVTVDVTRDARAERDLTVTFDQQQNNVTVHGRYTHGTSWFHWGNESAKFTVTVPSRYNMNINTAGGDIELGSLQGEVRCRTSGGDIRTGRIDGPVDGHTSGGDVSVDAASGRLELNTSGGTIHVGDAAAAVQAKSSGGSIDVHHVGGDLYARTSGGSIAIDEALGAVDAQTSGGSIRANFARQPRADSRLSTSGGGITISVAPNVAFDVDAHTSGGDVDTDVPVTLLGRQSESSLQGKINGGGPKLVLRSSGGGIRLRKM